MQNFVQLGEQLKFTAGAAFTGGSGAQIGNIFGVVVADVANGATGVIRVKGVVRLPKATGAVTQFATVYWDNTAKNVTTTVGSNRKIGAAAYAQASGDTTIEVVLDGVAV
jgi:predicted RecA/RadA family phage recombinase